MRKRKRLLIVPMLASCVAVATADQQDEAAKAEIAKLQGVWRTIKFIDHSEMEASDDEIRDMTFEFRQDQIIQRKDKRSAGLQGKYRLDVAKKPKWLDINFDGRVSQGIYKLEGDQLSLCVVAGMRGGKVAPRPTQFKASKKAPHSLFVLKKVKDR